MSHPVVLIYLSYSTTLAKHAIPCQLRCPTFGQGGTCLFLSVQLDGQWVSDFPTLQPHGHGPTNVRAMIKSFNICSKIKDRTRSYLRQNKKHSSHLYVQQKIVFGICSTAVAKTFQNMFSVGWIYEIQLQRSSFQQGDVPQEKAYRFLATISKRWPTDPGTVNAPAHLVLCGVLAHGPHHPQQLLGGDGPAPVLPGDQD